MPANGFVVYLVDPGSDTRGIVVLLQDVLGVDAETAAGYLSRLPSVVSTFESERAARNLAERFRDFDAVAVVRRADQPLAPAPVEEVDATPPQRLIGWILVVLGVVQVGISVLWFRQGQVAGAFFGLLLALYVLAYFGPRLRR